jgi:hypothetical protein
MSTWALAPLPGRYFFFAISIGISLDPMFCVRSEFSEMKFDVWILNSVVSILKSVFG